MHQSFISCFHNGTLLLSLFSNRHTQSCSTAFTALKKSLHFQSHLAGCSSFSNNSCNPQNVHLVNLSLGTIILSRSLHLSVEQLTFWLLLYIRTYTLFFFLSLLNCFKRDVSIRVNVLFQDFFKESVTGRPHPSIISSSRFYLFMFYFLSFVNI